jgi:hypothetical protein
MDGTPTSGGNPSPAAACDESRPGGEGSPGALELSVNEYRLNRIGSESIGKEEALYPLLESVQATETSQIGTLGDSRGVALLRVPVVRAGGHHDCPATPVLAPIPRGAVGTKLTLTRVW